MARKIQRSGFQSNQPKWAPKSASPQLSTKAYVQAWNVPDPYDFSEVIGEGAYGTVCSGFDRERMQPIAVKCIRHVFGELVDSKRILREIAILSRLSHEGVVQLHDVFLHGRDAFDELYIVMEFCDTDLKKLCCSGARLTPRHTTALLQSLLAGLRYVHATGVVHRDLKPANCLVNQDCSVRICDFGLARAGLCGEPLDPEVASMSNNPCPSKERGALARHLTGHVATRWYRAPEVILLQAKYTEAIDIWSVGCIFAELLGTLDGADVKKRGPLFPGTSCFPLSPVGRRRGQYARRMLSSGGQDQLNVIFDVIGTPTIGEAASLEGEEMRTYLGCFRARQGEGLSARFQHAETCAVELLRDTLRFCPQDRLSAAGALEHELFSDRRTEPREAAAAPLISLDFELEPELDEPLLRRYFAEEIARFRPRVLNA